jgi:hypothetical protein
VIRGAHQEKGIPERRGKKQGNRIRKTWRKHRDGGRNRGTESERHGENTERVRERVRERNTSW